MKGIIGEGEPGLRIFWQLAWFLAIGVSCLSQALILGQKSYYSEQKEATTLKQF